MIELAAIPSPIVANFLGGKNDSNKTSESHRRLIVGMGDVNSSIILKVEEAKRGQYSVIQYSIRINSVIFPERLHHTRAQGCVRGVFPPLEGPKDPSPPP